MEPSNPHPPRGRGPVLLPNDEWVGGTFQMPAFVTDRPEPYRPLVAIWLDAASRYVLATEPLPPGAPGSALAEILAKRMADPADEVAKHRPKRVRISDLAAETAVRALFGPGIEVVIAPVPEIDEVAKSYKEFMRTDRGSRATPSYLENGRVPAELVRLFFEAAMALWEVAPWERAGDEQVVRLGVPSLGKPAACVSIIGGAHIEYGLIIFDSGTDYRRFMIAATEAQENPRGRRIEDIGAGQLSVNFDTPGRIPESMLREIPAHGWPLGFPGWIPRIIRADPDLVMRPLSIDDYKLAIAACVGVVYLATEKPRIFQARKPRPIEYEMAITLLGSKLPLSVSFPFDG